MPELPEVEIMTRALRRKLQGQRISHVEINDPKIRLRQRLDGRPITRLSRRGKFIFLHLDRRQYLLIHLRMTGWFEFQRPPRYRCAIHTTNGSAYFADSRRFGQVQLLDEHQRAQVLAKLGPEPFDHDFDPTPLRRTRRPIKAALLDQRLIAGVGNIYASESLWRAKVHPRRPAHRLTDRELRGVHRGLVDAMRKALRYGPRIYKVQTFAVYDREGRPCQRCRQPIRRIIQQQRSTFFCPGCQVR